MAACKEKQTLGASHHHEPAHAAEMKHMEKGHATHEQDGFAKEQPWSHVDEFIFFRLKAVVTPIDRLVHGNGIAMGIPSATSRAMGRNSTHLYFPWDSEIEWECQDVTELSYLDYTSEF